MNDLFYTMQNVDPGVTSLVVLVFAVTLYVFAKTILWWFLLGTGHLLFGKLTLTEWVQKTVNGLIIGGGLILLNAYLFLAFNPDNVIYMIVLSVCMLLASRIMWREFFTMFGLLRGDWYLFEPKLRFFHWEKFNVWVIFKPLKWIFSSPFHSSKDSFWEDFGKNYETNCFYILLFLEQYVR